MATNPPKAPLALATLDKSSILTDLNRIEVVFTALGVLLPQVISFVDTSDLSHPTAAGLSMVAGGVFTAFEAIKDGWNGTRS